MKLVPEKILEWLHTHTILVLVLLGGAILFCVSVIITMWMIGAGDRKASAAARALSRSYTAEPITHSELFVEDEPDFVPPYLYYRAPQTSWTPESVSQLWQKPDNKTIQDVRKAADDRISELLEAIP